MMSQKMNSGFTLIELMIVVAIVGILSALAAPAYQNYIVRSQVTEGLTLAEGWKPAILEYYANNGGLPSQSDLPGTEQASGKYETNITVNAGIIQIVYGGPAANPAINGAVLTLVPYTNDNNDILWQCGLAPPPSPTIATSAVPAPTTLAQNQLPTACQSPS
jgi:type IV pilus assembly protein PilA